MEDVELFVVSWNRFLTKNLVIKPELVGSSHNFTYQQHNIRIRLPSTDHLPTKPLEGDLLSFNVYRNVGDRIVPQEYWVHAVDVEVVIPEPVSVTQEVLNRSPNAYDVVPQARQNQLNRIAEKNTNIAEKALDRWMRTLRWKCNDSSIGRPEVLGHGSGWGTYLISEPTRHEIWIWREPFEFKRGKPVTSQIWKDVDSALQTGANPPISIELMFDGIEHMKLENLERAVVDFAVACESCLRTILAYSLPTRLSSSVKKYIDDAKVRSVLTKFVPELLDEEERKRLKKMESTLHQLFDTRNDIVHTGRAADLNLRDCDKYLEVTKALLALDYQRHKGASGGRRV